MLYYIDIVQPVVLLTLSYTVWMFGIRADTLEHSAEAINDAVDGNVWNNLNVTTTCH